MTDWRTLVRLEFGIRQLSGLWEAVHLVSLSIHGRTNGIK